MFEIVGDKLSLISLFAVSWVAIVVLDLRSRTDSDASKAKLGLSWRCAASIRGMQASPWKGFQEGL